MTKKDRLFVPLSTEPYLDFKEKGKQYEVRSCERAFSEKYVYKGRPVEIRKGYSGESLNGIIGKVIIGSLEHIMYKLDYKKIEPNAKNKNEAILENKKILGKKDKYIAFQILFN